MKASIGGLVILFLTTSCATIMGRSKYDISINTQPSNAIVHVQDGQGIVIASGVTPVTFELKSSAGFFKRARYRLQFFKEGYEEVQYPLVASLDGNYFFEFILLGGFGNAFG